ncbi:MAG TPA: LysM peptidoglycan-binding domain-containing protein [Gammaproteobacteria bacterium]|nr:LysM peptidoglycan-binding domain-containing protein [Gammaproteobacteria bacterium]
MFSTASFGLNNLEGIQIYSKNSTQKTTKTFVEFIHTQTPNSNLWDVLKTEFTLSHYDNNPAVQDAIQWCIDNQDFLMRTAHRSSPYLYFIHEQVKKRKLPIELILIPIIESGYNPFDYSSAGAAGLWQLMPDTASGLGVKQDWWYDGRRDVVASTKAALNYLSYLFNFFDGNPLLAIAAYNTGEGSVMSAIRRNMREGKSTDFWSLPLPKETRLYVPRILALATIISHPDIYRIRFPAVRNAPYLAQVDIGGQIDLKQAANFAGMSLKQFQQLNPGFTHLVTHPNGPYKLMIPIERVERFMAQLARTSLSTHIDWVQYHVKSHETLESIAKRFNTTSFALREINHLKKTTLTKGMKIVIPRTVAAVLNKPNAGEMQEKTTEVASMTTTESIETTVTSQSNNNFTPENYQQDSKGNGENKTQLAMQNGDTLYMVRESDTVEKIAERFNLSPLVVYKANHLHSSSIIHPGEQLLVPTHLASKEDKSITPAQQEIRKLSPGDTLYMVRNGDTIETIAQKFKTTAAAIRVANLMGNNKLQEGEHIIVPTHLAGNNEGKSFDLNLPA